MTVAWVRSPVGRLRVSARHQTRARRIRGSRRRARRRRDSTATCARRRAARRVRTPRNGFVRLTPRRSQARFYVHVFDTETQQAKGGGGSPPPFGLTVGCSLDLSEAHP